MTSIEVKNYTNIICRLAGSLRDCDFMCREFLDDCVHIQESMEKLHTNFNTNSEVLVDCSEIEKMQRENEEMKLLLSDYHRGVELMMTAYRQRALNNLIKEREALALEAESFDPELVDTIIKQSDQIYQMHNIMRQAAGADEKAENLISQEMVYLRKENETLRELYNISKEFGTAQLKIRFNELELKEIGVQTDALEEFLPIEEVLNFPTQLENQAEQNMFSTINVANDDDDDDDDDKDDDSVTVIDFSLQDENNNVL